MMPFEISRSPNSAVNMIVLWQNRARDNSKIQNIFNLRLHPQWHWETGVGHSTLLDNCNSQPQFLSIRHLRTISIRLQISLQQPDYRGLDAQFLYWLCNRASHFQNREDNLTAAFRPNAKMLLDSDCDIRLCLLTDDISGGWTRVETRPYFIPSGSELCVAVMWPKYVSKLAARGSRFLAGLGRQKI